VVENPFDDFDLDSFVSAEMVQKFLNNYDRADFLILMYPDKEALKASDLVQDLIDDIIGGRVEIPGFEGDVLKYWGDLEGANNDPIMIKGEEQFNNLLKFVSEKTGVSIQRINDADIFWAKQFFD
jgi:hypothetical protein